MDAKVCSGRKCRLRFCRVISIYDAVYATGKKGSLLVGAAGKLRNSILSETDFGMKGGCGNVRPFITLNADGLQKGLFLLQLI